MLFHFANFCYEIRTPNIGSSGSWSYIKILGREEELPETCGGLQRYVGVTIVTLLSCNHGFQFSGCGSVLLHHRGPDLIHVCRSSKIDAFTSCSPNSVPQDGQILKSRGGSSNSYPHTGQRVFLPTRIVGSSMRLSLSTTACGGWLFHILRPNHD
jgi:hypothetical protein